MHEIDDAHALLCRQEEYYVNKLRLKRKATSTLANSSLLMEPRRRSRRDFSIVITCSHLTSVKSGRPFSAEGAIRTCNGSSRSVRLIEATIVRGEEEEALPPSVWVIKRGRVPFC